MVKREIVVCQLLCRGVVNKSTDRDLSRRLGSLLGRLGLGGSLGLCRLGGLGLGSGLCLGGLGLGWGLSWGLGRRLGCKWEREQQGHKTVEACDNQGLNSSSLAFSNWQLLCDRTVLTLGRSLRLLHATLGLGCSLCSLLLCEQAVQQRNRMGSGREREVKQDAGLHAGR